MASTVAAFKNTITVSFLDKCQVAAKRKLIEVAKATNETILKEQVARSGIKPDVEVYVNRPGNTNLESVVLPGPIVYNYRYRRELVVKALLALVKLSPVDSGDYRDSHTLFVNGSAALGPIPDLKPTDELLIANTVPYARRIEIGRTRSGRPFVRQVPNRIYETAARQLQADYKNLARVRFTFVGLPGGYQAKGKLAGTYGTPDKRGIVHQRKRHAVTGALRYPALVIEGVV